MIGQGVVTAFRTRYPRLLRSDFLQHGAMVFLASNVANVLAYAFHFIASRALGVERYGTLTSVIALIAIAGLPSSIATFVAARYSAEIFAANGPSKLSMLIRQALRLGNASGLLIILVAAALSAPLAQFLHLRGPFDIVLVGLLTGVGLVVSVMRGILLGVHDFAAYAGSIVVESAFRLLCGAGFIILGLGVTGAVGGFALGSIIAFACTAFLLDAHRSAAPERFHVDVRRLLKAAGGVAFGVAACTVMSSLDMVLARHYLDARSAGFYGAVAQTGKILLFLCAFVPTLVVPKGTARASRGASTKRVLFTAAGTSGALLGVTLAIFALWPRFIVTALGGAAFAGAAGYVLPYGIAMAGLALLQVAVYYKISIHRFDFVLPLAAGLLAEAVGIARWHADVAQIVTVLTLLNFITLIGCLYRIYAPSGIAAQPVQALDAVLPAAAE